LRSGSAQLRPTVNTGLSELIGSWNTQAISPRAAPQLGRAGLQQVAPLPQDAPARLGVVGQQAARCSSR
jgi:hypothetical protein